MRAIPATQVGNQQGARLSEARPEETPRYPMASLADQFLDDLGSLSGSDDAGIAREPPPEPTPQADALTEGKISADAMDADPAPAPQHNPTPQSADLLDELLSRIESPPSPNQPATEDALLRDCVAAVYDVRSASAAAHARLRLLYTPRFPELEALLPSMRDYARAARVLGNDLGGGGPRGLDEFLAQGTVISVEVTASASAGRLLTEHELAEVVRLCDEADRLEAGEAAVLEYVESRAGIVAPNLTALVGGSVAAQLVGEAGGLDALARIPGCNIQVLGKTHKALQGGSSARSGRHEGVIYKSPLVVGLPPALRKKGASMVGNKAVLAARVDAGRESRDGSVGARLRIEVSGKFEKWQEPSQARTAKPLPVPDEVKRTHRAGKRARKNKELYGVTEMRKQANRINFGQAEAQYGNDMESGGLGVLGADAAGGRLRVAAKKTNSIALAANRRLAKKNRRGSGPSAAAVAGLTTTVQGIELGTMTPAPGGVGLGSLDTKEGTQSVYFSSTTGFGARRIIDKK
jgi:U4/U6 small nuclear ribonucleoprotein PRP31